MAQEQREQGTQKHKATTSQPSRAPKPQKSKAELEERQQRAQACMLQLGVTPVDVSLASLCVLQVQI